MAGPRKSVYGAALGYPAMRWMSVAFLQSRMGDFMYSVALVAVVFVRTGSPTWVAVTAVAIRVPLVVLPTFAGMVADRVERRQLMLGLDVARFVVMSVIATLVFLTAPVGLIVVGAVVMSSLSTPYGPAQVGLQATLVAEDDLAAANALGGGVDALALLAGPAVGGLLLLLGPAGTPFAIDAGTFAVSALCLSRVGRGPKPEPATGEDSGSRVTAGFRALGSNGTLMVATAALVATCFTVGATTVLFLVVSVHRIGTGAHGYGYLLAAAGAGGVIATAVSDRFASARRMATVTAVTLGVIACGIAVLAAVRDPAAAYVTAAVWGGAYLLLELLVVTLMQRCVASSLLGQATAAVDTLAFGAVLAGAAAAGPVSQHAGLTTAALMVATPALLAGIIIAARSRDLDSRATAAADLLAPRLAILSAISALAGADRPTLEALAARLTDETVTSGTVVIRQGTRPDDFFVVVDGTLDVASSGGRAQRPAHVRSLSAGDVFGEIGLVEHRPRTATVTATSAATLYRIPGEDFLTLIAGTTPAASALGELAAGRLRHTHRETALG